MVSATLLPAHHSSSHGFAGCLRLAWAPNKARLSLAKKRAHTRYAIFLASAKLEPASGTTFPGVLLTVPVDADLRHGSSWLRQPESKGRRGERVSVIQQAEPLARGTENNPHRVCKIRLVPERRPPWTEMRQAVPLRHDGAGCQTIVDGGRALPGRRNEGEWLELEFDDTPHTQAPKPVPPPTAALLRGVYSTRLNSLTQPSLCSRTAAVGDFTVLCLGGY